MTEREGGSLVHFVNLTRGLLCDVPEGFVPHFCRIQSTQCEQKLWTSVIMGAGPDLLMNLAVGNSVIVHDMSEKPRTTRAMWQGLTFIRRACEAFWHIEPEVRTPIVGRGGKMMSDYFEAQLRLLPKPTVKYVKYYRQYRTRLDAPVHVWHCMCWRWYYREEIRNR